MGDHTIRFLWAGFLALATAACGPGPIPTDGTGLASAPTPPSRTSAASPSGEAVTPVPVPPTADPSVPVALARTFVQDLLDEDYTAAWSMLAPETQDHFGTEEAFASDRAAFRKSPGREVVIGDPTNAPDQLALWLTGIAATDLQAERAFVVEIDYPALRHTNSTPEVLLIAPDTAGNWRIWIVR